MIVKSPDFATTVTKKPDGTIITDTNGHWHINFPARPDGSVKTYYENGTNVVEKYGKVIKRFND